MNEQQYTISRAKILDRMYHHAKKLCDGRYIFPRCLAADYRDLKKLDKLWQQQQ